MGPWVVGGGIPNVLFFGDVIVYPAVSDSGFTRPGVNLWTWLTSSHVPDATLVPEVADLWVVTFLCFFLKKNETLILWGFLGI